MNLLEENIDWTIKCSCLANKSGEQACNALLEVGIEDIYLSYRVRTRKDKSGKVKTDIKFYYTFMCPCCKEETFIKEEDLPLSIKKIILIVEKEKGRRKIASGKKHINC
ncbi:MAG: hypothetical protein HFE81_01360 [Bacilli bacterium]|nr:hypothetical protein [Bacilli bacterium]